MKQNKITLGRVQGTLFPKKETLTEGELNHHVHIVGASGFGKTVMLSHIVKQTIEQGKGLLFIDLKGDIDTIKRFTSYASASNREKDLQIFSLSNPAVSSPYNLIEMGTATQIKDKIMSSLTWSEEYYKNQSASFLLKLLIGLVFLRDVKHKSFGLGEVLRCTKYVEALEELFIEVSQITKPESKLVKLQTKECVEFLNEKENYSSLQGLRTQLEALTISDFGDLIAGTPGINLFEAVNSNKITYFFLDSRRYSESSKAVGRFILQDLKSTSAKIDAEIPSSERKPFVCVIDEFADLAQEDFLGFLDRARSSKMSIVLAHQELSDLLKVSQEFAGRLMGNTSTLYAFLQKRPESAEMIASTAGTHKAWKETIQTERLLFFNVNSGKKSLREVEEFNIHPNQIKTLKVGECVAIKKYPYSKSYVCKVTFTEKDSTGFAKLFASRAVTKLAALTSLMV